MNDRSRDEAADLLDTDGPGSDPGVAYERAEHEGQASDDTGGEPEPSPGVEDAYRSGS